MVERYAIATCVTDRNTKNHVALSNDRFGNLAGDSCDAI